MNVRWQKLTDKTWPTNLFAFSRLDQFNV